MPITHAFISSVEDQPGGDEVKPQAHWNAPHVAEVDLATEVSGVLAPQNGGYSDAVSRAALSATSPITYNSSTGEFGANPSLIDHGTLAGLADDDHTQYHTDSRAISWLGTVFPSTGIMVKTDAGSPGYSLRSITSYANQLDFENANGVAGNPRISLASSLILPGTLRLGGDLNGDAWDIEAVNNLDITGQFRMPGQPCFIARQSASLTGRTKGADVQITFNTEIKDQAGNFSSSTFTAPVGGTYLLGVGGVALANFNLATRFFCKIVTSNRNYSLFDFNPMAANPNSNIPMQSGFVMADMDAGDTAQVITFVSGGSSTYDLSQVGNETLYFFGMLIA